MTKLGEKINAHVQLAVAQSQDVIILAAAEAGKAGVGVRVRVEFTEEKIIVTAEPDVRVPMGKIVVPDFKNFKFKE